MSTILEIKGLNFSYNGNQVLKNIDLTINEGDYLGVIGENGGGKTTLIKLILGLVSPSSGSIKVCGKNIKKFASWHEIGYVAQRATSFDQNFPASVEEIVGLGLLSRKKIPRFLTKEDHTAVDKALKKVHMGRFADRRIGDLSGGQQQRVLIARALVCKPRLLILDEPTTGVDAKNQGEFYDMLAKLNKEGITVIIVSHDISYITKHVSKVAYVNQKLVFHGTHKQFCSSHVVDKMMGHEKHVICHDLGLTK